MVDASALNDLDDVLNGLGFDEKDVQKENPQSPEQERRGSVLQSSAPNNGTASGPSRPVSTRVNNRGNRQSNLFSASTPLGHDNEVSSRNSLFIAPVQSTRASVVINKTENTTENSTADSLLEAGNRRSIYDPDHLELPDFRPRDSVSFDRHKTTEIGIDTINSAFALQSMLGNFMGGAEPEEPEQEPEPPQPPKSEPPKVEPLPATDMPKPEPGPSSVSPRSSSVGLTGPPDEQPPLPVEPPPAAYLALVSPTSRSSNAGEIQASNLKQSASLATAATTSNYVVMPAMTSTHILAAATASAATAALATGPLSPGRPTSPSKLAALRVADGPAAGGRGNRGSHNFTALRGGPASSPANTSPSAARPPRSVSPSNSAPDLGQPPVPSTQPGLTKSSSNASMTSPASSTTVALASLTSSSGGRNASSRTFSYVPQPLSPGTKSPRSSETGKTLARALTVLSPRNELVDYKTQQQTAYYAQQQENLELLKKKKEEAEWQRMRNLTMYKRVVPSPHEPVTCMIYADMRVIAGTREGSIMVLDANAGDLVEYKPKVHGGGVTSLVQVGSHLLSAADDGTLCLWERKSRSLLGDKDKQTNAINVPFQTYRGWVTKQGIEVKSWKHRWLVLDQEELLRYYGKKEDTIPKGTINLVGASVEKLKDRDDKKEKKFYFSVGTKDRVFHMFANTEEERSQWVDSIAAAIELSRTPSFSCVMTRKMKRGVLALTAVHAQAWIGCMEPVLHVWDTVTNTRHELAINFGTYVPDNALVTKLVWSKTRVGGVVVWGAVERAIVRFDAAALVQLDCLAGAHQHGITALANNGDTVISASRERLVMWHESGEAVQQFDLHFPLVYAILPLGMYIWVCGYNSSNVEVLNVYDKDFNLQKELNEGKHHTEAITSLVVANWDSCWSASKDSAICIWR